MKRIIFLLIMTAILMPLWAQLETDFNSDLTDDASGIIIKGYTGQAVEVRIPATIQGIPVKIIAELAFARNQRITRVIIPESVTEIGINAFLDCRNLIGVTLSPNLTVISNFSFANSAIESIEIPEGVTTIGTSAFANCSRLTTVTLPATIALIETNAFNNCSSLISLTFPSSVTSIQIRNNSFSNCRSLPLGPQAALRRAGYRGRF
ncbi:MAG: leucine-rich repeat domain-containing protein [Treponema sp.]|jgi:hypothetical protein|nr:leucine-rich repeat domain-containing protein [Treponema sp.]